MAEEALDRVQIGPGFEQVRGKRVAQGVDASALVHAGLPLRGLVDALGEEIDTG